MRPTRVMANAERESKTSFLWPDVSRQLEGVVKKCPTCIKQHVNTADPAIHSELPDQPWQKLLLTYLS